jgi:AcrR family transcriptional regulator
MPRPGATLPLLFERAALAAVSNHVPESADTEVFDAALIVLAEVGTKAATMDDVAARSGVSRATLFRRFGGKDALFEAAIAQLLRTFLTEIMATFTQVTDPTERIVEAFAACLQLRKRFLGDNPQPGHSGEVLTILAGGDPSPIELGRQFIATRIAMAQADGLLPPSDPAIQADAIIRLTLGYLVVPDDRFDLNDPAVARDIARRTIAPLVTGALH